MPIYPKMAEAMRTDDANAYGALLHDDFQYVRHKSRDTLDKDQMVSLLARVWANGNRTIEELRCIYENDDILVLFTRLAFASGSREGAVIVNLKKDGLVIRTETGVSDLT